MIDPRVRVVHIRPRTVLSVLATSLAVLGVLYVLWHTRQVLTWILIAVFLALAVNPFVEWLQRRGIRRRGAAVALGFGTVLLGIVAVGVALVPPLADDVADFVDALPEIVRDLTEGRGRLGFLESRYNIVDRVTDAVADLDVEKVLAASGTALAVTKGVITAVIAVVTVVVLTFFMLLEGPSWVERLLGYVPEGSRDRWQRLGDEIYRTVGGYVTGALIIASVAGVSTAIVLTIAGVPYAFALALVAALLDLIPLAGATIATVIVSIVAFIDSVPAGVAVLAFFILYQQFENHVLYPAVYSRTVSLSPLAVLVAVLVGASLAGIIGAIAAIPVAGTVQVLLRDWLSSTGMLPAGAPAADPEPQEPAPDHPSQ